MEAIFERLESPGDARGASVLPFLFGASGALAELFQPSRTRAPVHSMQPRVTRRALGTDHLELAIPIFGVARTVLDVDAVTPGQDWSEARAVVADIRAAYLNRFPAARQGWTAGHLERLSIAVLALPTYLLMRRQNRVESWQLHPALSAILGLADVLRKTMHKMLFVPIGGQALAPATPITGAEVLARLESNLPIETPNGSFDARRAMMREFIAILIDGGAPTSIDSEQRDPQLRDAARYIRPAIDYALHGQKAYAAISALRPVMLQAYEKLWKITDSWAATGPASVASLRDRLRGHLESIKPTAGFATDAWRTTRQSIFADMYGQCVTGLTRLSPKYALESLIAPQPLADNDLAAQHLRTVLVRHFRVSVRQGAPYLGQFLSCLTDFLRREQAILRLADEIQRNIDMHLGREESGRPYAATDIELHSRLQCQDGCGLPHLVGELEQVFGIRILLDKDRLEITDR